MCLDIKCCVCLKVRRRCARVRQLAALLQYRLITAVVAGREPFKQSIFCCQ